MRPDQKFEKRIAELFRRCEPGTWKITRTTRASGALPWEKGDILHPNWHIEAKYTESWPLRFQYKWWDKCAREADHVDKTPLLALGVGLASTLGYDIAFILHTNSSEGRVVKANSFQLTGFVDGTCYIKDGITLVVSTSIPQHRKEPN